MSFGILPSDNSIKLNRDVNSAQSAHSRTGRLKNNQTKSRKKGDDKSAAAVVKSVRQLSCVSQNTEPPDSVTILGRAQSVGTSSTRTIHKSCMAPSKHPRK